MHIPTSKSRCWREGSLITSSSSRSNNPAHLTTGRKIRPIVENGLSRICILTDSSAQFLQSPFLGYELVNVIPYHVLLDGELYPDSRELRVSQLPETLDGGEDMHLLPPSTEEFLTTYSILSRKYDDIIVILASAQLSAAYAHAQAAIENFHGPSEIILIDSQTTTISLGLIVQAAAAEAVNGLEAIEIHHYVRKLIPHTYAAFCTQSLSYLSGSGYLDPAQAMIGELMGVTPFFMLENGRLTPVQKVRNSRHLIDLLHEYISEFNDLKHIALIQGYPPYEQEARSLKERFSVDFPHASFSEHLLNASLALMFGPRSIGIVAVENGFSNVHHLGIE